MGCASSSESKQGDGENSPREIKVVMLGNGGVGKSAITYRFVHSKFNDTYNPTIEDSYRKDLKLDGQSITLDILDTAGQEEYIELREVYMRGGEGFIIVYSITDKKSFKEVPEFRERTMRVKDKEYVPMILVGNKADLEQQRQVSKSEGEELAKSLGMAFIETSAATGLNTDEVFQTIARTVLKGKKSSK
ncbi:ras-1 [Planoprotostelium fungivorum]|uniref:small monomeric GTPase n=1 Tax=Planoprotostelium fungivorum TaxID=1890364 RepID=A0A2P6NL24_9EUKA|nr:ras-1 [Planoprotostelium fungivorum]